MTSPLLRRLSLLIALFCADNSIAVAADAKRIMLLHSFGREFKPWSEYAKSIRTELERQSPWGIDIVDLSLVSARTNEQGVEQPFVDYLHATFNSTPVDLIIAIGAPAAAFVQRHRPTLFATIPMVLTAIDQRRVQFSQLASNDTVVAVRIDYLAAFENILRVLPETNNIVVVVGTSPIEKFWKEAIAEEVKPVSNRVTISWTDQLSFTELLQHASNLPRRSAIFWELMIVDAANVVHEGASAISKLHAVANAPIFSYDESFFDGEIVGGPLLRVIDTSQQTAAVALRILGGEAAGDIKVPPVQFGRPMFSWREMQRWGIADNRLPEGSEIYFRQPTVWEVYRWQLITILIAVFFQAALIYWLLYERRHRLRSEVTARSTLAELTHRNRLATGGELSASIAHEVIQPLTGMVASANAGLRWLGAATPNLDKVRETLTQVVAAGHRTAEVVRAMRAAFKKDTQNRQLIEMKELLTQVLELVQSDLNQAGIESEIQFDDGGSWVVADRTQLQQVVLNLIANAKEAMRDSKLDPKRIQIRYSATPAGIRVSVADTGPGVAPDKLEEIFKPLFTTKDEGMGLGLSICRTIIEAHGGRLFAAPNEPRGLVVQLELPLDGEVPDAL